MQANLLTQKWLEYHADRLSRVKLALGEQLRKYETHELPAAFGAAKRRAVGSTDLRLLLNQIDGLQLRLGQYRPTLAATLGDSRVAKTKINASSQQRVHSRKSPRLHGNTRAARCPRAP